MLGCMRQEPLFANNVRRAAFLALTAVVFLGCLNSPAAGQAGEPGIKPPRVIHQVSAEYTEEAKQARISGEVVLEIDIDDKGNVERARITRSLDNGLDENAMAAVRKWKFKPATRDGEPVAATVSISVKFALL
jgi:TonB family protein